MCSTKTNIDVTIELPNEKCFMKQDSNKVQQLRVDLNEALHKINSQLKGQNSNPRNFISQHFTAASFKSKFYQNRKLTLGGKSNEKALFDIGAVERMIKKKEQSKF